MRTLQIIKELLILAVQTKPWNKSTFVSHKNAILIRKTLERLGSVFIKFGQMLALRPDFISDVFCNEFYKLLDQVPSFSTDQATSILKQELGSSFSKILDFETTPIASASLAQVHKARLENGAIIAVKIQRPDIDSLVYKDLRIMRFLAWLFDLWFKPTNKVLKIVEEFETWTKDELDYNLEAGNIKKFNELSNLVGDGIRGPRVYEKLSSSKVLIMEYIEGYSLTQIIALLRKGESKKLTQLGFEGEVIINKLLKNMLEMSHIHGFFHGDPHPANIIFTPEQELVFIDFGIVGNLTKKERTLILRYFRTLLTGNANESLITLLELCDENVPNNIEEIKRKYKILIDKFVTTFDSKTYLEQQIRSGPILTDTLNLLQNNGVKVPVSIVRYFKAFETVEGLILALYPELQIQDMLKEFRRVSIINIVDALPTDLSEKNIDRLVFKLLDSIEKSLLLSD